MVKAEVPGMDAKDVNITLNDGLLTIKGEKKVEKEEKDEGYHLTERRYGSFSRSIRLPSDIQSDKIKANYKNGLLTITMPKSEKAKTKEIKVKVE
jgi:HSP20 family protein